MQTLHDIRRELRQAQEQYAALRHTLDDQQRTAALQKMLRLQRDADKRIFVRTYIDFDLPPTVAALPATTEYFQKRWSIEDAILAHPTQRQTASWKREERAAIEELQRIHNDFYDAVDMRRAQVAAAEHALGFPDSPPPPKKERYKVQPAPRMTDTPKQPFSIFEFMVWTFLLSGIAAFIFN